jgi:hypothetical protein
MNTIHIYKYNIDKFISLNLDDLKKYYVYGGVTKQELKERHQQHTNDKKPIECNHNWDILKITTLKIKDNHKLEEYKKLITDIENYLIIKLDEMNNDKCVNSRDKFGYLEQTGGRGVDVDDMKIDDEYQFYLFYGHKNNLINFH